MKYSGHSHAPHAARPAPVPQPLGVRVGRLAAASKAVVRVSLGSVLLLPVWLVWPRLEFRSGTASNRLEDYSLAFVLAVVGCIALWTIGSGIRWLALACWPKPEMRFGPDGIRLRLGPFGRRSWSWAELDVRYRHEMTIDVNDPETLELDDPEVEETTRLPVIRHPSVARPINEIVLTFAAEPEPQLAPRLRPLVHRYRNKLTGE